MAARPISIRALRGAHQAQVAPRLGVRIVVVAVLTQLLLLAALLMLFPGRARAAEAVKGELSVNTSNGYARLIFALADEVEADVRLTNGILIVAFKRPVALSADRIVMQAQDYVSAARIDPDLTAVRMALKRKVTVNTMAAGEKLFVDLLPEDWTGLPPGLPQDVVDELARRAREAEKRERARKQVAALRASPPVRVRVGAQPTFTRYTFGLPALIPISIDRSDDRMTLTFESPLKFDLADVQAALPPIISGVEAQVRPDTAVVRFDFAGKVDVRTFREDNSYIVDVQPLRARSEAPSDQSAEVAAVAARVAEKPTPAAPAPAAPEVAAPEKSPVPAPAAPQTAAAEPAPAVPAPAKALPPPAAAPMPVPRPAQAPNAARAPKTPVPAPRPEMAAPATPPANAAPPQATPPQQAAPAQAAAPIQAAPPATAPPHITFPPPAPLEATRAQDAAPQAAPQRAAPAQAAPEQAAPAQAAPAQTAPAAEMPRAEPSRGEAPHAEPAPAIQSVAPATVPAREAATTTAREEETKPAPAADPTGRVTVEVQRQGDALRIVFPFAEPTAAAMFRRSDTIWLVFDSAAPIDISGIAAQSGRGIRNAALARSDQGQVVQLKLDRPKLTSASVDGASWTLVIGDTMLEPAQPLGMTRVPQSNGRANVAIPFNAPSRLHRIADPAVGDTLLVVTALGPARGFVKPQEFVEFNTLVSAHGVVIQPLADDIRVELGTDKLLVTRPGGLALSNATARAPSSPTDMAARRVGGLFTLDPQTWGFDREADYRERQQHLVAAAAAAEESFRLAARLELARFYLARDMIPEAKGVLDAAASDERAAQDGTAILLRAIANVMLGRGADALKDLASPPVAKRNDIALWRAIAQAQEGRWADARDGFRGIETTTATLPLELQRFAFQEAVRAAIEVHDFGGAARLLSEFDTLGPARERDNDLAVLKGRVMEGLGRMSEALALYQTASGSVDRPAAARGMLREIALRQSIGDMKREDAADGLERLTTSWRGDETEAEALQLLSRVYAEDGRYRDAFQVMRTALVVYPRSEMTRRIQDEAAAAFEKLFLGGKGDSMAPIDALGLFYDYRDLTPVGRRGDEMIRKLADRLVSVDLLDQAAEVLQHQVDHRLQGAARAQVAVKLAIVYLMGRKPDRAIQVLRSTRVADLPNELRNQRLLIEARAQSDTGRAELGLEVIADLQGREVDRLRADILWRARRWREAGEQIEKYYGDRWRDFAPLAAPERADVLRAAIGYALGEDAIGLERFRNKYAPKMAESPDRGAFQVVTQPFNTSAPEFAEVARAIAMTDTLEAFLRDIRTKYPETSGPAPGPLPAPPAAKPATKPAAPERGASAATERAG
jgi:tetratricopeptide (TPR) repeat protein